MKDINLELEEILIKYQIVKRTSLFPVIDAITRIEEKYSGRIGLYGCGKEADSLLTFISRYLLKLQIEYCFDKTVKTYHYKDLIKNTDVTSIESIQERKVDCIIIGSYKFRKELRENLYRIGYSGEIFDSYEYLGEYFEEHFSDYEILFKAKQSYLSADRNIEPALLKQLIKEYLLIKDFQSAFEHIEIYCQKTYPEFEKYLKLEKELKQFLQEIKDYINQRGKKDIIINWIDALSYYDLPDFPFLQRIVSQGICYENAYTVMPWTTETTKAMLCGEHPIEGKLFLRENFSENNAKLLKILSENGYGFAYCGRLKFAKLFDSSVEVPLSFNDNKWSSSLPKQWDAIDILCKSDKPMCILVHTLRETHQPYICGEVDTLNWYESSERDWKEKKCQRQAAVSGEYIDNRLAFYESFYGKNAVKIYMSDHGRVGNLPFNEKKIHVFFSISGNSIHGRKIKEMFSLVSFPKVIRAVINDSDDWEKLTDEYVLIENLDGYTDRIVTGVLSGIFSREEMLQCRGIVTRNDKYYLYADGREYYFPDRMSVKNEIQNPIYKERIEELKNLCGNSFIDIYQYDKFKYSRLLYVNDEQLL